MKISKFIFSNMLKYTKFSVFFCQIINLYMSLKLTNSTNFSCHNFSSIDYLYKWCLWSSGLENGLLTQMEHNREIEGQSSCLVMISYFLRLVAMVCTTSNCQYVSNNFGTTLNLKKNLAISHTFSANLSYWLNPVLSDKGHDPFKY